MLSEELKVYKTSTDTRGNSLFQERREKKSKSTRKFKPNDLKEIEKDCLNDNLQATPPLFSTNIKDFSTKLDALLESFSIKMVLSTLFFF